MNDMFGIMDQWAAEQEAKERNEAMCVQFLKSKAFEEAKARCADIDSALTMGFRVGLVMGRSLESGDVARKIVKVLVSDVKFEDLVNPVML